MSHITRRQAGHGDREKGVGFTQGGMHIKDCTSKNTKGLDFLNYAFGLKKSVVKE